MKTQFDTDLAWNKLYDRMLRNGQIDTASPGEDVRHIPFLRGYRLAFRIAAAVLLIAGSGFLLYFTGILSGLVKGTELVATQMNEEIRQVSLPDGSEVTLNSSSRLTYPKKFKKGTRTVTLAGEAYFEVAADPDHPFVIETGDALVKAVGTSFNVNGSGSDGNVVKVLVENGRVELIDANDTSNRTLLEPGYSGTLNDGRLESGMNKDINTVAWMTKRMDFRNTPLSEVVNVLHDVYKVEIVIQDPAIDTTRIIGNYDNDPLDLILEIICTQNHLKIEKSNQKIYLSPL